MNPILSFPKIESDKSTAEQLAQMKSYLRQFKSEVELVLSNIDADNVTQTFEADMFEGFSKRLAGTDTISQISQTTGLIKLSVKDLEESEASLIVTVNGIKAEVYDGQGNSRITQNANAISSEVTRATNAEGGLSSRITQTADAITAEVTRATGAEGGLSSRITQNADAITAEVTRATGAEGSLSSRITQNADAITLKVSKSSIVSELNSHMSSEINISYDGIEILSDGALVVNTDGFKLDEDGNAEFSGKITSNNANITGATVTGDITANTGTIGVFDIDTGYDALIASNGASYYNLIGMIACKEAVFKTITLSSDSGGQNIDGSIDGRDADFTNYNGKTVTWKEKDQVGATEYVLVGA